MKKRSIVLCILFSIITGGIYGLYWFVSLTNATNKLAPEHKSFGGVGSFFLGIITCGIYYLIWAYRLGQKTSQMEGGNGGGVLNLILELIGLQIVNMCLGQSALNHALDRAPATPAA